MILTNGVLDNGEVDADGYLLDKDGKPTAFLPSQNINAGYGLVARNALTRHEQPPTVETIAQGTAYPPLTRELALQDVTMPDREAVVQKADALRQSDPAFAREFEAESLRFLREADGEWFNREFNGEVDADGYLLDKDGKPTAFLPSQNINAGYGLVARNALTRYVKSK